VRIYFSKLTDVKWKLQIILISSLMGLLIPAQVFSQNLVDNPSFEAGQPQCDFTIIPYFYSTNVMGWNIPNASTADVFSTVIPNKACYASMPDSGIDMDPLNVRPGSILPHTGSRFVGIFTYEKKEEYREYIQGRLTTPLVPGQLYCVEMYVAVGGRPRYASNGLGIYFSAEYLNYSPHSGALPYTPQIVDNTIITSTNWVRISGVYKATTASTYFTIGNFKKDEQTMVVDKGGYKPNAYGYEAAYYFIDDVSVRPIVDKTFVLSGNNSICMNETATLIATSELEDVHWTTLSDTVAVLSHTKVLLVKPTVNTTYRVAGKNCGLFVSDTITVFVKPIPQIVLAADTTICQGTQLKLDAGAGYAEYHWSNGSRDQVTTISDAGNYAVTVKNEFGCAASDQIKIDVLKIPTVNLGRDTTVCDTFYPLIAHGSKNSFEWSTGARDSVLLPTQVGTYWVAVTNQCGTAADTISVYNYNRVFIPNVVTPNNDHHNDYFVVRMLDAEDTLLPTQEVDMMTRIYNRWGTEIFSGTGNKNKWPQEEESGSYFYTITMGACRSYKGWVQVIR
jgi:hypothetical protein